MKEILSKSLEELLRPRTIFAFMFYGCFCALIMLDGNPPETLTNIVLVILGHYFGEKSAKKGGDDNV